MSGKLGIIQPIFNNRNYKCRGEDKLIFMVIGTEREYSDLFVIAGRSRRALFLSILLPIPTMTQASVSDHAL
jgi:hypothetical protein